MQQAAQVESSESSSRVELVAIPDLMVESVWLLAEPFLAKATARTSKVSTSDFLDLLIGGHMQLWLIWTHDRELLAALVTEIVTFRNGWKVAKVVCLGGRQLDRWRHLMPKLESWARDESCDALEIIGRPGWGKIFQDYREIERTFAKELA